MEEHTIVDNDFITIKYLPDRDIIHHTIHKPISGEPLQSALTVGADCLEENGVTKWLSDDRKNGPLPPEEVEWGMGWSMRMINAGWKYWANVVPEDIKAAGTLAPAVEDLHKLGLRMMLFTNVDSAIEWLDSLD